MIDFHLTNTDTDNKFDVTATTRDVVAWETSGRGRSFKKLMDDMRMTDLYELAYHASVRTGNFVGSTDKFKETIDLSFEGDENDVNPTNPDR